jgi:hypothetical protein
MALTGSPSPLDATISKPIIGTATPPAPDLSAKVAELEARLAQLERVLTVGPAGDVTIKASSTMSIESTVTMKLKSGVIMLN